ncbi:MAG TPA: GTPase [Dyella sp.]|uniref:GTPase n=1 Tax=Dyella sp. TaxID=1869338 RepID=UPI002F91E29D
MSLRIRLLLAAIATLALIWLLFAVIERALALLQRYLALPLTMQVLLGLVLFAFLICSLILLWWLLRPRRRQRAKKPGDRADIERRLGRLRERQADTSALDTELAELDRRRQVGRLYVALFGEISTGKSALLRALAPHALAPSDVRGGTTRQVTHVDATLPDGQPLILADVPGSREADGEVHEQLARQEALRAHAVVYLCAGDLTRGQAGEVRWLSEFGKPLIVALNKADQWQAPERELLLQRLHQQTAGLAMAVVAISAGGTERFERLLPDGSEYVERQRKPSISPLLALLAQIAATGADVLEPSRENAVLAGLHESTGELERTTQAAAAERVVRKYARRAVVGALAAVAPGSDLIIQGALAATLTRELAALYDVRVTDVQIEDFLRQARLTLRSGSSIVLAIAGNALKAFPGLGTLGGGVLHAFAYALIFDSMGRALAASLAERKSLDQADAGDRLKTLLADAGSGRLRQLATLTAEAIRERGESKD